MVIIINELLIFHNVIIQLIQLYMFMVMYIHLKMHVIIKVIYE